MVNCWRFWCENVLSGWTVCSILDFSCFLGGKDIKRTTWILITWENFGIKLFQLFVCVNLLSGNDLFGPPPPPFIHTHTHIHTHIVLHEFNFAAVTGYCVCGVNTVQYFCECTYLKAGAFIILRVVQNPLICTVGCHWMGRTGISGHTSLQDFTTFAAL
jgi:hypothetical protein